MIKEEYIFMDYEAFSKEEIINEIGKKAFEFGITNDSNGLIRDLYAREEEFNTDLGMGISIPHAKSDYVIEPAILFFRYKNEIVWGENTKVKASIAFLTPKNNKENIHLKALAAISRKLMYEDFMNMLLVTGTKEEIFKSLSKELIF